ncbi:hypothetical protein ACEV7X_03670 [Vibrio parahaemolyticus]
MMKTHFEYDGDVHEVPPTTIGSEYDEVRTVEGVEVFRMSTILAEPTSLKKIEITSVANALKTNADFTRITCHELSNLVVKGKVSVPNQSFSMPLLRDDGRLILFLAEVVNGEFTVQLNFPTSGQYIYTDDQANHDLPDPVFKVEPIKIDVLRAIQV